MEWEKKRETIQAIQFFDDSITTPSEISNFIITNRLSNSLLSFQRDLCNRTESLSRALWLQKILNDVGCCIHGFMFRRLMILNLEGNRNSEVLLLFQRAQEMKELFKNTYLEDDLINPVIRAYLKMNDFDSAVSLMKRLPQDVNEETFLHFAEYYIIQGDMKVAIQIFNKMKDHHYSIPESIFCFALRTCLKEKDLDSANSIWKILKSSISPSDETVALMINVFKACGDEENEKKFWEMKSNIGEKPKYLLEDEDGLRKVIEEKKREEIFYKNIFERYKKNPTFVSFPSKDDGLYCVGVVIDGKLITSYESNQKRFSRLKALEQTTKILLSEEVVDLHSFPDCTDPKALTTNYIAPTKKPNKPNKKDIFSLSFLENLNL